MTIYQEFRRTAMKHSVKKAIYWKKNGRWQHLNYLDFLSIVDRLSAGLKMLGAKKGDRMAIFSENRAEWLAADLAINKLGAVSVPIHTTANQPLVEYILKDSGCNFVFASGEILSKHQSSISQVKNILEDLKIVCFDDFLSTDKEVILYRDLLSAVTQDLGTHEENELASIVYTSGTTGEPKGVMLTNRNLISNAKAAIERAGILNSDLFLSFLPLSHVLERTCGSYVPIFIGATIAYAEGIKQLSENMAEIKPTVLISVPKIFEKIEQRMFTNIQAKGGRAKQLFFWALKQKKPGINRRIADFLVYRKIRHIFGGRLRFAICGGAPIHEKIVRLFDNVGVKIYEGYGLTETSPIVSGNGQISCRIGTVGKIIKGIEVKISDDKEIYVRGENVMRGYWNKEEMTKEVFSEEGWFKTGDLGFLDSTGFLTIIGRKKDIIVLKNGKKVFPEKIEAELNQSPLISQSLLVGHGKDFVSMLVVPENEAIKQKFKGQQVDLYRVVEKEVEKVNEELMQHEKIKKISLLDNPFTIEENELTPTLKVRRHFIENKYKDLIERLYK